MGITKGHLTAAATQSVAPSGTALIFRHPSLLLGQILHPVSSHRRASAGRKAEPCAIRSCPSV